MTPSPHSLPPQASYAPGPTPAGEEPINLTWQTPKGLVSLSFINFALRILTLGVYTFWARTEVRKRIWSGVRVNGQPLQYTGTGKELFKGFVFIFLIVVIPLILVSALSVMIFGPESTGQKMITVLMYAGLLYLVGMGTYRAWRYRFSRTRWRGIRAALVGSDKRYAGRYFWTALLIPLTLGWIAPWRATRLQELITDDTRFGDRPFEFTALARSLYLPFSVLWFGSIAIFYAMFFLFIKLAGTGLLVPRPPESETLPQPSATEIAIIFGLFALGYFLYGIVSSWYRARQFNHFSNYTYFESGQFRGTMSGLGLMWITVSNFVLVLITLGILTPIAQARLMRYTIEHLEFVGTAPLQAIAQRSAQGETSGEGLAQAFDIDGF